MLFYALAVFLSSFLLFQIQPLISKYILPWFGGTTSVWSASLLFFQILLTGGYAYAYWLNRLRSRRWQRIIHLGILGGSLFILGFSALIWEAPILPTGSWRSFEIEFPLWGIFKILFVAVGVPYFLLATNSTLMQSWFHRRFPNRDPYWLYALSNVGSLVGLLSYPLLLESAFTLRSQAFVWSGGFVIFVIIFCVHAWRNLRTEESQPAILPPSRPVVGAKTESKFRYLTWLGLAALGSGMLLATTSRITQEVAVIPFLWVLPLTVYLLSFILAFSGKRIYNRWVFLGLLLITTVIYLWFVLAAVIPLLPQIGIYLVLFFLVAMICHGELYRLRPVPDKLPKFYLWVSAGGALGGVLINFFIPLILTGFWEFQIGLGAVWAVLLIFMLRLPYTVNFYIRRGATIVTGLMASLVLISLFIQIKNYQQNSLASYRNFYGILNVKEKLIDDPENHHLVLTHGITMHGYQFQSPEKRDLPTAYYVEESGVGIAFRFHSTRPRPLKAGMIGLGVGVQAAYGQEGDIFRFYEINPQVVAIAQGKHFTFLRDSAANIEVFTGDGRLFLEQEFAATGSNQFDLLVLDAFNSDSIPTHLLTLEAFELYRDHLKTDGILALHISNQHLNLRPVIWQLAEALDLDGVTFYNTAEDIRTKPSLWILLTNNPEFLTHPEVQAQSIAPEPIPTNLRLWTDDYSSLFQILK
jgi:hypothetical protein